MRPAVYIGAVGLVAAAGVAGYMWHSSQPHAKLESSWAMIDRYCVDCHNDVEYTGDLSLEGLRPENVAADAAVWEKALHKLNIGLMPPRGQPQPEPEVRAQFVNALVTTLDASAKERPYAGVTAVHRLNRAEYQHAIPDLLGVHANIGPMLPRDGGDFGSGTSAARRGTSPMLLERYLTVALRVADLAVGNREAVVTATTDSIPVEITQGYPVDGLRLGA